MPGVLVESHPFPSFDSSMLSSPFESNVAAPPSPSCDGPRSDVLLSRQPLVLSPLHYMDFGCTPPSSPSEKGSPRFSLMDARDEFGQRVFPRSLSKLGGLQSFAAVSEDEAMEGEGVPNLCSELPGSDLRGFGGGFSSPSQQSSGSYVGPNSCSSYSSNNSSSGSMVGSPVLTDAITALQKFLPSNNDDELVWPVDSWPAMDVYSCDDFRMYEFKVRRCMRGRSHDWTECPFAHPGEKARRRDPRRIHYSGTACPDFRKGSCKRGDACEYAHGVFECWLHPARYRTQPCKDGKNCKRRVCFFAHTLEQLRVLPSTPGSPIRNSLHSSLKASSYDGSPLRQALASSLDSYGGSYGGSSLLFDDASPHSNNHLQFLTSMGKKTGFGTASYGASHISSPTSTLIGHSQSPPPLSPPLSPSGSPPMSPDVIPRSLGGSQASAFHAQSPLSPAMVPAHRRHLDRLHTLPTVSIPPSDGRDSDELSYSPIAKDPEPSHAMSGLITTLQNLELKARVGDANRMLSPQWSLQAPVFQSNLSRSFPSTATKSKWVSEAGLWECSDLEVEAPVQRVESGRDLRAKIYGKIGRENGVENETPDVDWVSDLVK